MYRLFQKGVGGECGRIKSTEAPRLCKEYESPSIHHLEVDD